MTTLAQTKAPQGPMGWLYRAETWLDEKGKGAWIVATVLAFIFVWPLGLALLAYMIWSKKMFSCPSSRKTNAHARRYANAHRATGNAAFDAYRADTLRRLEEEQDNFESFLQRLRDARDKAEFDQFMEERAKSTGSEPESEEK